MDCERRGGRDRAFFSKGGPLGKKRGLVVMPLSTLFADGEWRTEKFPISNRNYNQNSISQSKENNDENSKLKIELFIAYL